MLVHVDTVNYSRLLCCKCNASETMLSDLVQELNIISPELTTNVTMIVGDNSFEHNSWLQMESKNCVEGILLAETFELHNQHKQRLHETT